MLLSGAPSFVGETFAGAVASVPHYEQRHRRLTRRASERLLECIFHALACSCGSPSHSLLLTFVSIPSSIRCFPILLLALHLSTVHLYAPPLSSRAHRISQHLQPRARYGHTHMRGAPHTCFYP
jgi:hypothetical protein